VNETAVTLVRHHVVAETFTMMATRAAALTGAAGSFVELFDRERQLMTIVAATGIFTRYVGRQIPPGQGTIGAVHRTAQPLVLEDLQQWQGRLPEVLDIHATATIPILSGEEVLGSLGVAESNPAKRISAEQVELLTRLAQLASIAIDNARLIADAQREVEERALVEAEVRRLNAELEGRVIERTAQLQEEVSGHRHTQEALEQRSHELAATNMELAAGARMKDEFLANMSHELRTPLNAILGMAEVLVEGIHGALNAKQERSARVIAESGNHLLELINDILDLSKIEAGKVDLDIRLLPASAVAQASLLFVRETAMRKRLSVVTEIDPAVETIDADERRLKQILVNLLSNAVKFTPEGGSIGLTVEGDARSNEVRWIVWDTGIGIAEPLLPRLFTPFYQIDSSYTRQYSGTGLGLSLVRRFAALHGGRVDVESSPGKGSRFAVTLPWRHLGLASIEPKPAASRAGGFEDGPVLIIEDDATSAEQIVRYATELGLQTVVSDGAEDPVELAMALSPRVIVLDILFEATNGWQMLAALKAFGATSRIPVILASVVDDAARGLSMGAAVYLRKPIRRDQFEEALRRVMPLPEAPVVTRELPLVLLAEDNKANIEVMESYLSVLGMRIALARDGIEAVSMADALAPDLILMDVQMPRLDGLEAIRRIRRAGGAAAAAPIVALTALAMTGDRDRCLAAGATDYLTKPVTLAVLRETVNRLVRRE
jgi:signal transduction histidine kinase/CheY-like chemotaxis protein